MPRLPRPIIYALASTLFCVHASVATGATTSFPEKPVRLIIPFAPGGATDVVGRYLAQNITHELGQQVIVDNRPGSGGVIASQIAARANPDGYTLLLETA